MQLLQASKAEQRSEALGTSQDQRGRGADAAAHTDLLDLAQIETAEPEPYHASLANFCPNAADVVLQAQISTSSCSFTPPPPDVAEHRPIQDGAGYGQSPVHAIKSRQPMAPRLKRGASGRRICRVADTA